MSPTLAARIYEMSDSRPELAVGEIAERLGCSRGYVKLLLSDRNDNQPPRLGVSMPQIEMKIGRWHRDEHGNLTREIRAK